MSDIAPRLPWVTLIPSLKWALRFALIVTAALHAGCATTTQTAFHAFSFDALRESPGIEILEYRYGDRGPAPTARVPSADTGRLRVQSTDVNGRMPVGSYLYVRWMIKASREIFEDNVDLRGRLPADMDQVRVHFVVHRDRLYVYLVNQKEQLPEVDRNSPLPYYSDLRVIQIYPDKGSNFLPPASREVRR